MIEIIIAFGFFSLLIGVIFWLVWKECHENRKKRREEKKIEKAENQEKVEYEEDNKFCHYCRFSGKLVRRIDGKWFHDNARCMVFGRGRLRIYDEEHCYVCGFKEGEASTMGYGKFVERSDGKKFHGKCAVWS